MTSTERTSSDLFALEGAALAERFDATEAELSQAQAVLETVASFSTRIKEMRTQRGVSRSELAERIGVTEQRVAQLESGTLRNAPSLKTFAKIAHTLGYGCDLQVSPIESPGQSHIGLQLGEMSKDKVEAIALYRAAVALKTLLMTRSKAARTRKRAYEMLSAQKARAAAGPDEPDVPRSLDELTKEVRSLSQEVAHYDHN